MGSGRFSNLDALRGICALTVMLFHCGGLFAGGQQSFCHGYLAVDVFFILSGFVLAHTYEQRLTDGLTVSEFLKRRLTRLAPVYWAGTVLCAAAFALTSWKAVTAAYSPLEIGCLGVMAIMLAPQLWFRDYAYPVNLVAWSLAGELIANLLYGRWLHRFSTPALLALIAAGWGICLFYGLYIPSGWDFGALASDFYMCPIRAIPSFLAGVVLWRAHRAGLLARLPALPPLAMLLAWVVIASVPASSPTPLFDFLVVAAGGPLIVALLARSPQSAPGGFLWLGAISYPLYASHRALISVALDTNLLGRGAGPLRGAMVAAAMLAVGAMIHYLVERAPRFAKAALMEPAASS